ncbi:MAG: hypothetical protein P4M13_07500 [Alphaproteobacteria bacterium]|nr:hypothetical protein [Alphaproteobacteria bacterium]
MVKSKTSALFFSFLLVARIFIPCAASADDTCHGYSAIPGTTPEHCAVGTDTAEYMGIDAQGNVYILQTGYKPTLTTDEADPDFHALYVKSGSKEKYILHFKDAIISIKQAGKNKEADIEVDKALKVKAFHCQNVDLGDLSTVKKCVPIKPFVNLQKSEKDDAMLGKVSVELVKNAAKTELFKNWKVAFGQLHHAPDRQERFSIINGFLKALGF